MKIQEQQKTNEVKEKMLLEQSEMQARNDAEKKDTQQRAQQTISELQEKILSMSELVSSL